MDAERCDVSVLTPSYGYGRFIGDALASVACQEGVRVEHVVQDGGSEDETVDVLRTFAGRVRWRSAPDGGQSDALNRALLDARGGWIGWLNADEFYLPEGLRTLVEAGERSGADVVYGDAVFVDEEGKLVRLLPEHAFSGTILRTYGTFIASCATLFRRSALGERPWDRGLRRVMDWDLFLTLLASDARFLHVPFPVAGFRLHDERVTAAPPSSFAREYELVSRRHRLSSDRIRRLGFPLHAARKVLDGAYRRQLRARRLRASDLRWFRPAVGPAAARELVRRCYGG